MKMLSLSDNEFSVLDFLVRNFTERLTIRGIAQHLNFSAAGVFNILKKLEKNEIVIFQKLGTGLFYQINLESRIARHLAAVVLLHSDEKISVSTERFRNAKAAIFDKKTLLLMTDNVTALDIEIPNIKVTIKTEDEIAELLKKRDTETIQMLKKGAVLFGEEHVVNMIKNCMPGL